MNPNKGKGQGTVNAMCCDGKYITVDQNITDHMNMCFCEIREKLQDDMATSGNDSKNT